MMRPRSRPPVHRGMTLAEVLAVVVIVSMASAVTMVGLTSASDDATFRAARAAVHDLDAKVRLLGRTGTSVVLAATDDHSLCILDSTNPEQRLSQAPIPAQVAVQLEIDGTIVPRVTFDRLGRSDEYAVVLRAGSRTERWNFAGLTGWMSRVGEYP